MKNIENISKIYINLKFTAITEIYEEGEII